MTGTKFCGAAAGAAFGVCAILLVGCLRQDTPEVFQGAVITQDPDPSRQLPISGAEIAVQSGASITTGKSDESGFFKITLPPQIDIGRPALLRFVHPDYQPLDLRAAPGKELLIARLVPSMHSPESPAPANPVNIENVVVRYSVNTTTTANVGSAVKTFQVVNKANVPCQGAGPCSLDGQWKAAIGTAVLDAGKGNVFHNARASCIAGPCPFTRIMGDFARDSQLIHVSALDWSDTATFLVEAEVFHPTVTSDIRQSYPVIFERALTFVLPGSAEGVSIEAQFNGSLIVFPLGPALILSWANCQTVVNKDNSSRVYRCELKPGYRIR